MYDIMLRLAQLASTLDAEGLAEEASNLDQAIFDIEDHMASTPISSEEQTEVNAIRDQVSQLIDTTVQRLMAEGHSIEEMASTDLLSNELTSVLQEAKANVKS
jgi:hypothetical protein